MIAVSLAMSACAPTADPARVSALEHATDDPFAIATFERALLNLASNPESVRPTVALTLDVPGEWTGQKVIEKKGRVMSFVATDAGPRAVVRKNLGYPTGAGYTVFAEVDGIWQRRSGWLDKSVKDAASFVAIGNEVVAVGPRDGQRVDEPWAVFFRSHPAVPPPANDGAAEVWVRKAAAGDGVLMAIGRRDDRATAWLSADGIDWSEVALPIESSFKTTTLSDLAFVDGRWIIAARFNGSDRDRRGLVVMTSEDGRQWQRTRLYGGHLGTVVVGHDGSNVLVHAGGFAWRSVDGTTWGAPFSIAGTELDIEVVNRPRADDGTVFLGAINHRSDYRYCFETDQPCQSTAHTLLVLDDGAWSSPLAPPNRGLPHAAAMIDDVLYVGGRAGGGTAIYRWSPERGDHLPRAAPLDMTPPTMTLPLASSTLERGVVYAAALPDRIECVHEGGQTWRLGAVAPGAIDIIRESGAIADSRLFGTIELVERDLIEFVVPGYGPIGYLEPQPSEECFSASL